MILSKQQYLKTFTNGIFVIALFVTLLYFITSLLIGTKSFLIAGAIVLCVIAGILEHGRR